MLLSKSCEYAIRAAVHVGYKTLTKEKTGISEVAEAIGAPVHFTARILQGLSRKRVISSSKGPHGGFYIENSAKVYLIDIIRAIEGDGLFNACILGLKNCSDTKPCPVHDEIKAVRTQLLLEFNKKSLRDLVSDYHQNKFVLK
ncbi:RrF2 family transcriptional regulator [Mucilaginibacter rubeus]|uniref:RrF2 family transcriptional regulator n=1 Tax=Mucilaginibacter rubeus TaxID=2027860 RepID=UPI00166E4824|nr:Rrf2 family transcriptional regulator [Mucilaginibacter rubeus]GGA92076.1 hypothetical protein GCM10011500_04720 [Mucilaginibacter rubeus]